jgi:hypothetical protein
MTDTRTRTRTRYAVWGLNEVAPSWRHRVRLVLGGLTEHEASKRAAAGNRRKYPTRYVGLPEGETPPDYDNSPAPPFPIPGHPGYRTDKR